MSTVEITQGLCKFLVAQLEAIIAGLNTDLAGKVESASSPPAFIVSIGDVPNPVVPTICVVFSSQTRQRAANDQMALWSTFKILCLIPTAGDNTPMNFEMCMQVSTDHVSTLFLQDDPMLLPVIDRGGGVSEEAEEAGMGDIVNIWPRKSADNKTYTRGWQTSYSAKFNIETR